MKKAYLILIFLSISLCATKAQTKADQLPHEIASEWLGLQTALISTTEGFTPPVVARMFGYTGLTLYESIVGGTPRYQSLAGQLNEMPKIPTPAADKNYNWALVANSAQAYITLRMFDNTSDLNKDKIRLLSEKLHLKYALKSDEQTIKISVKYGEDVAKTIYNYSKSDGGHEAWKRNFPLNYTLTPGACMWIPVGKQIPLQPTWGQNRTFVAGTADFHLPEPPRCEIGKSSLLYAAALEVYSVGKNLSTEQKEIAQFWSDDPGKTFTPPGHGISIATQLVKKENLTLDKAAEVYCRVGLAAHDAFVSCWKCKYMYNILRPVSFIQSTIDPSWQAYLENPPFPEYTSGHGTVSGAIAMVLSDIFGYNYAFTDHSHDANGLKPRSFDTFLDFAQEAAMSRLYGGIHYRMSNEEGLKNGKRIGKAICELKMSGS